MTARPRSSGGRRLAAAIRALLVVLRVLVVLGSFELTGVVGTVSAVLAPAEGDESGCCSDCPFEKDGDECPPGCPDCHCSHGATALPALREAAVTVAAPTPMGVTPPPYEARVSRAPLLPGVYRPPRDLRLS